MMEVIVSNGEFHGIQLGKDVIQLAAAEFIGDSGTVVTLLEGTILAGTFDLISQSELDVL
uniref:Uncharacterized protein n=1 Tax=Rhizophora mucronata TaxID=61149 RepID=A0A2P2JC06_RHIMU